MSYYRYKVKVILFYITFFIIFQCMEPGPGGPNDSGSNRIRILNTDFFSLISVDEVIIVDGIERIGGARSYDKNKDCKLFDFRFFHCVAYFSLSMWHSCIYTEYKAYEVIALLAIPPFPPDIYVWSRTFKCHNSFRLFLSVIKP